MNPSRFWNIRHAELPSILPNEELARVLRHQEIERDAVALFTGGASDAT